jgi:hypothetical protein
MQQLTEPIYLKEQAVRFAELCTEDVIYLNDLCFQLSLLGESAKESTTWRISKPLQFAAPQAHCPQPWLRKNLSQRRRTAP